MNQPNQTLEKRRRRFGWLALGLILLIGGGLAFKLWASDGMPKPAPGETGLINPTDTKGRITRVIRGPLTISLLASGAIEAQNTTTLINEVEGDVKIIWLIDEGKIVKAGDKLVELEASGLQERLVQQQIQVASAQANYDSDSQELEMQKRQNQSDLQSAHNMVQLAELDMQKYQEGEYTQTLLEKQSAIQIAQAELERARDRLQGTEKLVQSDYVSVGELKADRLTVQKQELQVAQTTNSLSIFLNYEHKREMLKLDNDMREANDNLDRVEQDNIRKLRNKEISLEASKNKLDLEQLRLSQLQEQAGKTMIIAPQGGMVVYSRRPDRGGGEVLEVGTQVHNRQQLIDLPDFSAWKVVARIHESQIQKVALDQEALITIDALPDARLTGKVSKISVLPDRSNWWSDAKEYLVDINLTTTTLPLKPGMTAKTEIVIDRLASVLQIPMQAVASEGRESYTYLRTDGGFRRQPIEVGPSNDFAMEVRTGLVEGDEVLMGFMKGAAPQSVIQRPSANQDEETQSEEPKPATDAVQDEQVGAAQPEPEPEQPEAAPAAPSGQAEGESVNPAA